MESAPVSKSTLRLTEVDVERLLALKARMKAQDEDWTFPNRIKKGKTMKPGPIWHEDLLGRVIQPVAEELGLPHITCRLLRHWGATQMVEARVPLKATQQRLGHSRPDILLNVCAHVLDASADLAAATLSGQLGGGFSAPVAAHAADQSGLIAKWLPYWLPGEKAASINRSKLLRRFGGAGRDRTDA